MRSDRRHLAVGGFTLYDPGYRRTDHIYDSDRGPLTELACDGSCDVVAQCKTQMHEYVVGKSTKRWEITLCYCNVSGLKAAF
jgi:hypothetical protein